MSFYLQGWQTLHKSRTVGVSVNPITIDAIVLYCTVFGIDDVTTFVSHIQSMDQVYLEWEAEKSKK